MTTRIAPTVTTLGRPRVLGGVGSAEEKQWRDANIEQSTKILGQIFDVGTGLVNSTQASIPSTASTASQASSGTAASTPSTPSVASTASSATSAIATFDIPAGLLGQIGEAIEYEVYGSHAANGNSKTVTVSAGGTVIATTGALAANNKVWWLRGSITRELPAVQQAVLLDGVANNALVVPSITALTKDETGTITLSFNGSSDTAGGDVIINRIIIRLNKLKTANPVS